MVFVCSQQRAVRSATMAPLPLVTAVLLFKTELDLGVLAVGDGSVLPPKTGVPTATCGTVLRVLVDF